MTLHRRSTEVGVRELHDRLSEHLDRVERGAEIVVTRRGKPVARLSSLSEDESLDSLVQRGLISLPSVRRSAKAPRAKARGSVSDLVADQRR